GAARINQDKSYQQPGQSVDVEADTTWQHINVAGNFDVNLDYKNIHAARKKDPAANTLLTGYGAQGTKGGIGATIDIQVMDNTTKAQIGSGAQIHIGSAGSLTVNADQQIIDISLNQAGASAGDIGFSGTVVWNNLVSKTTAQIADGVLV